MSEHRDRNEIIRAAQQLVNDHPDWGRRKINAELREKYGVGLRSAVVNSLQKEIPRYERFIELRQDGFKKDDARRWSVGDITGRRISEMREMQRYQAQEGTSVRQISIDRYSRVVANDKLLDLIGKLHRIYPVEYLYGYRDKSGKYFPGILSKDPEILEKQFMTKEWKAVFMQQENIVKDLRKQGLPLVAILKEFAKRMREEGINPYDDIRSKEADYPKGKGKGKPPERPERPPEDRGIKSKIQSRRLHRRFSRKIAVQAK